MARTTFSGPVASDNGFEGNLTGNVDVGATGTLTLPTPTAAGTAGDFSATLIVTITGSDGNTYYIPAANADW